MSTAAQVNERLAKLTSAGVSVWLRLRQARAQGSTSGVEKLSAGRPAIIVGAIVAEAKEVAGDGGVDVTDRAVRDAWAAGALSVGGTNDGGGEEERGNPARRDHEALRGVRWQAGG